MLKVDEVEIQPNEINGTTALVDRPQWRRIALEAAGYVFLIWAALVAFNVFAFTDPAARAAAGDDLSRLPQILTHIPRNFGTVFALLFTLGAGIAPGDAVLRLFRLPARDAFDRIAFGTAAGLAVLTALAYLLATVQLLRPEVEVTLLLLGVAASAFSIRRWLKEAPLVPDAVRTPRALTIVFCVLLGASLYVSLLAALNPEVGFDARYYHLVSAERYAQHGGFYNLVAAERMWAFALPHYEETLYAFQWVLAGMIGAKLIAWAGGLATVLAIIAFSRAWFSSTAVGVVAATVMFTTPVVAWSTTTANNDLAAVPFIVLALHALLWWQRNGSRAALCGAGVFAGITYGIKPFGAFTIIALGAVAALILFARRTPRKAVVGELAAYAGCALLALLPALVTAEWMIGDPLFPVAPSIFPSRFGASHMGALVVDTVASRLAQNLSPVNVLSLPWAMTVDSVRFRDLLGPIWLATLPLWLCVPFLVRRTAEVIRPVAGFAAIFTAIVLISGAVEFRYIETALPAVALVIAYGLLCLDWREARALQATMIACVVVFAALDNGLLYRLQRNAMVTSVMGAEYLSWPYLYEGMPESAIQLQYVPMLQYTNTHLDPHRDRIYDGVYLQVMNLYSEIELFNGTSYDGPTGLKEWTLASPDAYARLRDAGCTYAVVSREMLATLKNAPVSRHLKFVVETPSMNGPKTADELLKVAD